LFLGEAPTVLEVQAFDAESMWKHLPKLIGLPVEWVIHMQPIQLILQSHFRFELANQSHFCRTAKRSKQMHDQLGARNVSIW
jgi:hypothetical protein